MLSMTYVHSLVFDHEAENGRYVSGFNISVLSGAVESQTEN